jgi:hypothetical protein
LSSQEALISLEIFSLSGRWRAGVPDPLCSLLSSPNLIERQLRFLVALALRSPRSTLYTLTDVAVLLAGYPYAGVRAGFGPSALRFRARNDPAYSRSSLSHDRGLGGSVSACVPAITSIAASAPVLAASSSTFCSFLSNYHSCGFSGTLASGAPGA